MRKNDSAQTRASVAVLAVLLLLCCIGNVLADETMASFEQPVPFGVACSDDGSDISVFRKPQGGKSTGALHDRQICAVVSTEKLSGGTWYRVNYFDDSENEVSGYVEENSFKQLTAAGLIAIMSDPEQAAYIQQFSGLAMSAAYVVPQMTVLRASAAAATPQPKETEQPIGPEPTYVLNRNRRKFHLPTCPSVDDIKESNRKNFYGTREELIEDGYSPCGKCHP